MRLIWWGEIIPGSAVRMTYSQKHPANSKNGFDIQLYTEQLCVHTEVKCLPLTHSGLTSPWGTMAVMLRVHHSFLPSLQQNIRYWPWQPNSQLQRTLLSPQVVTTGKVTLESTGDSKTRPSLTHWIRRHGTTTQYFLMYFGDSPAMRLLQKRMDMLQILPGLNYTLFLNIFSIATVKTAPVSTKI